MTLTQEKTRQKSMHIINALKNGVVPDEDLELLCVGRSKEMQEFDRCLELTASGSGVVKFVKGEYGAGKTFMLNAVKQTAVKKGFIVSKFQVDGGFRFNHIDQLFYHIMHHLSLSVTGRSVTSFEGIFDLWLKKLQDDPDRSKAAEEINRVISELNRYNLSFSRAFLVFIKARIEKNQALSDAAASWLMGEKNIPAALKAKLDIVGSVDKLNSVDFLKAFIHLTTLLGYQGLVVLIDEMELLLGDRSDIRRSSYENLRNLIDLCCSGEMPHCMFVFAATADFFDNPEKGLRTYEALSQRLGDALAKAGTALSDLRQPILQLQKLSAEDFLTLADKVIEIYRSVYPLELKITNESIRNWTFVSCKKFGSKIGELGIREYLTKMIEVLDIMEQHPDNKVFRAELSVIKKTE